MALVERADRVLVLDSGRLVQEGTVSALSSQEGTFQRLFRPEVPAS
jgi:ABC-type multidrug transport system fused ATPase/permease subunit